MVAKLESVIRNTLVLQPARTLVQNFIKFKTCVYSGVCNYLASEKKCSYFTSLETCVYSGVCNYFTSLETHSSY
jgi:hypothetical protein